MTGDSALPGFKRWRAAHTLAVAATLLAAILRMWHLGSLPPPAWYDEIWFALRAREMLQTGQWVAHYGIADTAGNAGLVYWTALARLFGLESIVGARAVTALAGVLTVPLAYACLRELVRFEYPARRWAMAALAALVLAYLVMLVILGRVGIEPALAPPVTLLAVWQVLLGLRRKRMFHWALAGLVAGLAQYNGPHARFILPLIGYVLIEGLLAGGLSTIVARLKSRRAWAGPLVLLAVATLVALPLMAAFVQHPDWFYGRAESVSAGISLPENALRVGASFVLAGDLNARQNLPGQPLFDVILGVGFLVGFIGALWRVRRSRLSRLLLVWLLMMAVPSALTAEAPNFGRMIGVAPPAAMLAVIGWLILADWITTRRWAVLNPRARSGLRVVAVGLVILSLSWNITLVFSRWAASPDLAAAFNTDSVQAATDLAARAASGRAVYVERLPETLDEPAFTYSFAGTPVRRVDFRQCVPLLIDPARSANYLFLPEDRTSNADLLKAYRRLDWTDLEVLWARQARLAEASGGLDLAGPVAEFAPGLGLEGVKLTVSGAVRPGETLPVRLFWAARVPLPDALTAFIHLYKADAADQAPAAQADRPPCGETYPTTAWQPGEVIAYRTNLALPPDIPSGDYLIAVGWYNSATGQRAALLAAHQPLPDNRAVIGKVIISSAR